MLKLVHQVSTIEKLLLKKLILIIYIKNNQVVLVNMLESWDILNLLVKTLEKLNVNLLVKLLVPLSHHNILPLFKRPLCNWWTEALKQAILSLTSDMFFKMVLLTLSILQQMLLPLLLNIHSLKLLLMLELKYFNL